MNTSLFAGFGVLWIVTGFMEIHGITPRVCLFVVSLSLLITAMGLLELRSRNTVSISTVRPKSERAKRMLSAVTIIEAVSIATVATILTLLRLQEYMVAAIAMIVGLHLLPLATKDNYSIDRMTSGLLLAWSLGCIALVARNRVAVPSALGAGCIMLASILPRRFTRFTADAAPGTWRES